MEENRIEEIGKKCQEQPHKYKDSSFNFDKCSEESQDVKIFQKKKEPDNYQDPSFDETQYLICSTIYEKENLLIQKAYKPEGEDFKMVILKHESNN